MFLSLADRDKDDGTGRGAPVRRARLRDRGDRRHRRLPRGRTASRSTRSSPRSARRSGVDAVDLISSGKVDLVVNTPRGRGPRADGMHIRRAAIVARRRVRHDGRGRARGRGRHRRGGRARARGAFAAGVPPRRPAEARGVKRAPRSPPGRPAGARRCDLAVELGPVSLPNPVVAASGTFGHGAEVAALCDPRGLGAVTAKSVAVFASEGNPPLRVAEAPGGGMLNSVGLPGPGRRRVDRARPARARSARRARHRVDLGPHASTSTTAAARPLQGGRATGSSRSRSTSRARTSKRAPTCSRTRPTRRAAATRAVVDALGRRSRRCSRSSRRTSPTSSRSRGAALDAGATGLTLVNTVMGLVDRRDTRAPAARRGRRWADRAADQADRAARGVGGLARVSRRPDHRDRRRDDRRGRDRDAARGRDRGRRRHRDVRRPARDVAHRRRDASVVRRERRRRRREPDRRSAMTSPTTDRVRRRTRPPRARARRRRPRRGARQLARSVAPVVRRGQGRPRAVLGGRAGGGRTARATSGLRVFADLKLHDIPTTVGRAARVLGRLGCPLPELPRRGRRRDVACGRRRADAKARARRGRVAPVPIAVTVLTSDPDASAFDARLACAIEAGCGGVVCSVQEIARVHARASGFRHRRSGRAPRRRRRARSGARRHAATALRAAGADVLVVGRAVSAASDPRAAAQRVSRRGRRTRSRSVASARGTSPCKPSPSCDAARYRYADSLPFRVWHQDGADHRRTFVVAVR